MRLSVCNGDILSVLLQIIQSHLIFRSGSPRQARRHAVKSGPAEVRARAQDTSEGESTRGGIPPLVRGVRGISPEKIFDLWLPLCAF